MQYLTTLSVFSMPDNTLNISFIRHYGIRYPIISLQQQTERQEKDDD